MLPSMNMPHVVRHAGRVSLLGLAVAAAVVAGCDDKPTAPAGTPFPSFALTDVNPNTPTSGQALTQDWLAGPAAVVYFGWAT